MFVLGGTWLLGADATQRLSQKVGAAEFLGSLNVSEDRIRSTWSILRVRFLAGLGPRRLLRRSPQRVPPLGERLGTIRTGGLGGALPVFVCYGSIFSLRVEPTEYRGDVKKPILNLEGVCVEAGGVSLLEGIRVSVDRGEIVGLYGPSGCGKSTLLRCVAGLSDASSGEVRFKGRAAGEEGWPGFRRQVVLVAQQPALLEASVEENLARVFTYQSSERAFPKDEAAELLDRLEVGAQRLGQPARSLSVGQQQRVCLVRALLIRPVVLLLDEPASALDAEAIGLVEELLRESVAEGRCGGILLVTHDLEQIERLCDKSLDLSPHAIAAEAVG